MVAVLVLLPDFVAFAAIGIIVALTMSAVLLTILLAPIAIVGLVVARIAQWMLRGRLPAGPWTPYGGRRR